MNILLTILCLCIRKCLVRVTDCVLGANETKNSNRISTDNMHTHFLLFHLNWTATATNLVLVFISSVLIFFFCWIKKSDSIEMECIRSIFAFFSLLVQIHFLRSMPRISTFSSVFVRNARVYYFDQFNLEKENNEKKIWCVSMGNSAKGGAIELGHKHMENKSDFYWNLFSICGDDSVCFKLNHPVSIQFFFLVPISELLQLPLRW